MDYTTEIDTDATGRLITEFNVTDLASLLIQVDSDTFWGLNDLSMAKAPLLANSTLALDWLAFPPEIRTKGKMIRIFMKRQVVGTLKTYVSFMGRT